MKMAILPRPPARTRWFTGQGPCPQRRGNCLNTTLATCRQEEIKSLVLYASVAVLKSLRRVVLFETFAAAVVKVDAANDLALLKAVGAFKPLPIAASRTVKLGGSVATVGFPDIGFLSLVTRHASHQPNCHRCRTLLICAQTNEHSERKHARACRAVRFHPRHRRRAHRGAQISAHPHALSAGAERLPAYRPREKHLPELRHRPRVRRRLQPAPGRHQSNKGRHRACRVHPGGCE